MITRRQFTIGGLFGLLLGWLDKPKSTIENCPTWFDGGGTINLKPYSGRIRAGSGEMEWFDSANWERLGWSEGDYVKFADDVVYAIESRHVDGNTCEFRLKLIGDNMPDIKVKSLTVKELS